MQPTNKLRFVERELYRYESQDKTHTTAQMIRILQQWWERFDMDKQEFIGEWRDVPLQGDNND